jgi:hypothetical protein
MPIVLYKNHLIVVSADCDAERLLWTPRAFVTWTSFRRQPLHNIPGLPTQFTSSIDAEKFALAAAKNWIDIRREPVCDHLASAIR